MVLALVLTSCSLNTHPLNLMEALSQLDIQSPDHVSVITRDGKMTVSVTKDGAAVTVSMPIHKLSHASNNETDKLESRPQFDTTPRPPLQQSELRQMGTLKVTNTTTHQQGSDTRAAFNRLCNKPRPPMKIGGTTPKLTVDQVREIKMIISDKELMSKFNGVTQAYHEIGKAYNITGPAVRNIATGVAWRGVTV